MRARTVIAGFGLALGAGNLNAQLPQVPSIPANAPTSPASALPVIPIPVTSPGQPIPPGSPQSQARYPVQPASSFPGGFTTNTPGFPQNPSMTPPSFQPGSPAFPQTPGPFPLPNMPSAMQPLIPNSSTQGQVNTIAQPQEISLPAPENKIPLRSSDVTLKRMNESWQLWVGHRVLRDFGDREIDARNALRVYQDLHPTEWVTIGTGKPIVEYGLMNGHSQLTTDVSSANDPRSSLPIVPVTDNRPLATGAGAKQIIPIDLRTVRVEPIRGVWCLRDNYNLQVNFGLNKADAEQALAAVRKYGFNRVGIVGNPIPAMTYFFSTPDTSPAMPSGPLAQANLQMQIEHLSRVGIPVAGVGYVGEMVRIDTQKLDVRKDGGDWIVLSGTELLGRYGPSEWMARDAARTIQESHFTEYCKVGSAGLTFFLVDGRAPTRVPLNAQGRQFELNKLKVRKNGERWAITENGRHLFDCASAEEGDTIIRLLQYYQFDQLCHIGTNPKYGISFLAKTH